MQPNLLYEWLAEKVKRSIAQAHLPISGRRYRSHEAGAPRRNQSIEYRKSKTPRSNFNCTNLRPGLKTACNSWYRSRHDYELRADEGCISSKQAISFGRFWRRR
jgi:hypothetical protein